MVFLMVIIMSHDDTDDGEVCESSDDTDGGEVSWFLCIASPQQGDLRLSGHPSGQGTAGGARTRDRRVTANLRADSRATVRKVCGDDDEITMVFIMVMIMRMMMIMIHVISIMEHVYLEILTAQQGRKLMASNI
ncbi:LOW QUALITY PROTEIN: hypothetical protein PoB_003556000 [Plakobranchus ocellatus]|uniref:Uncharacterized protein n=1 Tax=Plakobranchus ocellatus TaxID=259542 RepID=A0AAV4ALJ9_9GAST|nr:LOW QUALITY PROTEIN: hypothetical protein PoB_003556000 [Plakobranchus ocellatus]